MNNIIKTLIIVSLIFISINSKAQEKFGSYTNVLNGSTYDILLSYDKSTEFSLWINAMSLDDQHQEGGILIDKTNHYPFLILLQMASIKYNEWVKIAKNKGTTTLDKPMWINSDASTYFKNDSWNIDLNTELYFNFRVTQLNGETKYLLIVSSEKAQSNNNPEITSNGYGLVFSSNHEINKFLSEISVSKISEYLEQRGATTALVKNNDLSVPEHYPQFSLGFKLEGHFSLGMNNVSSDKSEKYDFKTIEPNLAGGFVAGIASTLEFKRFYIQPELQFSLGSKNYYIRFYDHKYRLADLFKKVNVSTIDIPLLFGYKIWNYKRGNLRVFAGPKLRLNVGSKISYTNLLYPQNRNVTDPVKIQQLSTDVKSSQVGANTGFEFNFEHYSIGLNYNIIGDMYQTKIGTNTIDNTPANSLGITFTWNLFDTKK